MKKKKLFHYFLALCLVSSTAFAQDVSTVISKYTEDNGPGYMQPLATASGALFNSGYFHNAAIKKLGFQFYLGVVTSAAFIGEKHTTFMATTPEGFTPEQTVEAPTIVGPAQSVEVSGDGGTSFVFPAGLNITMIPFAIPQLSIGSVYGTDATFRYFAYSFEEEIGKISHFAWGIRHSVSQYVSTLPLDLAVGFYNSYFKLGDYDKSTSWMIIAQASKRISIFTFYGGLGYESSKMDIDYHDDEEEIDIVYDLKGKNNIRFTAGLTFNLGPVKLNVDYSLASQSTLSAGLGVGIGE